MRVATIALAAALAAASAPASAQNAQDLLDTLNRVLTPDQERDRVERRSRDDENSRSDRRDGERGSSYGSRNNPSEDRFWSEEARRVGYREMGDEERRRYDGLSGRDRDRFDEEAGYERKRRYERMSDSERRRYDEALEEMYAEIRRGRSRG